MLSEVGCLLLAVISLFDQVTSSVLGSMGFAACLHTGAALPVLVEVWFFP